ncbi:MAG: hypothetical protein CBC29_07210 [Methylococcaceae bacterium TMED69]|nr:MAG: hypothetical protein CBC29_07210 [Methylococcaceae bacterium TMED69]|tara:strand:+ start:2737 stop:3525 length:789 start_codon:yes stop_codon:yes gene_type:complete
MSFVLEDFVPEGPEVKKIGENLARLISGKTLISAEILSGRYIKKEPSGWKDLQMQLPLKIVGPGVHGKFCYWICDNETFVYSTLGLTGNWSSKKSKHSRLGFTFSGGVSIFYNDQRNFGTFKVVRGKHNILEKLKSLGPDMLSEDVSDKLFISRIKTKPNWGITKALMDQSIIAGVGNYIKSDSLWLSQISPHKKVCDLSDGELAVLNRSIKRVMNESYQNHSYNNSKFLIYGKSKDPDGNEVIKEQTDDKRSTYWVPEVQK